MAGRGGRFCEHGNLPYSCPKCREARKAKWSAKSPKVYAPPALKGGKIPERPWSLSATLAAEAQEAVRAVMQRGGGLVRMPAALGLRDAAATLLANLRHRNQTTVLLAPTAKAAEGWDTFLTQSLRAPAEEIDATGRTIRDWGRAATVVVLTPEGAMRNIAGLRGIANKATLFVDSPEAGPYADCESVFRLPFAVRSGFMAARFAPPPETVWPRLDALGGIAFDLGIRRAAGRGVLRAISGAFPVLGRWDGPAIADAAAARLGAGRAIVVVDGPDSGRSVEEALSRAGLESRSVGGAASAQLAERAGRAIAEGLARVLVITTDAPAVATGRVDRLVVAAPDVGERRVEQLIMAQIGREGRPLEVVVPVPKDRPRDDDAARTWAARVRLVALATGTPPPPVPWLADAGPDILLPPQVVDQVRERAPEGWHAVLGLLPELLRQQDEATAVAALADHYVAARLNTTPVPLAAVAGDPRPLLSLRDDGMRLSSLALSFHDAERAFEAVLRHDLLGFREAYAGAPLLHHLAPDPRALLVATLERMATSRLPAFDAAHPREVAEHLERLGQALPGADVRPRDGPPAAIAAAPHMDRLLAALEAERAHEEETSVGEIARLGDSERMRRGRTLVGLELLGRDRAPTGIVLRYGVPSPAGALRAPLPYTELSPGTLVDLSSGRHHDPAMRGTVAAVTAREVQVVVEESKERRAPGRDVRIDHIGNPKVYDLLARAVRRVYGAGAVTPLSSGLKSHLLLETAGSAPVPLPGRLFDPQLDPSQRAAVANAVGAPRLALIHGPPGTGKTTTLVEVIRQEVALGHRVLVTADSNAAVDNIMDACVRAGVPGVRTGPLPSLTRPHLAPFHIDTLRERAAGVDWLGRMPVVFTTHVSSGAIPEGAGFDVVIQDEASQATEPASLLSLQRAPRLVLAGDHLQLPPVVQSRGAEDLGLAVSLFERLHDAYGESHGTLLSVQYRMHPDIVSWSNARFYGGRVSTAGAPAAMEDLVSAGVLPSTPRAVFADVAGRETIRHTSKEREAEAEWIDRFVRAALAAGTSPAQIAVIAAYRAQMRLLRRKLEDTGVDVGTIDAFQGSERDLVIVSLVRGNPQGEVGFVREPRRLNVAVTRARRHLVVVGESTTLRREPLLASLLDALGRLGQSPARA